MAGQDKVCLIQRIDRINPHELERRQKLAVTNK